jgi:hypothetical protein
MTSFASVLGIATVTTGPTYEGLYGGDYEHKHNPPRDEPPAPLQGPQKTPMRARWVNRR